MTTKILKICTEFEFKKRHQPKNNIIEDENGELLADPHSVLKRWKISLTRC
jgi:hypothetical protein